MPPLGNSFRTPFPLPAARLQLPPLRFNLPPMASRPESNSYQWLTTGDEVFPVMLDAIASARRSIRLEFYIYVNDDLGKQFRDALIAARKRGVRVQVLIDSL